MNDQDKIQRTVLPIPDQPRSGLILYHPTDPKTSTRRLPSCVRPRVLPTFCSS